MSDHTRRLVQESWPAAEARAADLTERFYARLWEIDPSTKLLFAATDMPAQREKLVAMLTSIVRMLDDPDALVPSAAALARRHITYGVESAHYASVGDALLWSLAQSLGETFTPELRAAWAEAYALLAGVMGRAAERTTDGSARAHRRAP